MITLGVDYTKDDGKYITGLFDDLVSARNSLDVERYNNLAALYGHQWSLWDRVMKRYDNYLQLIDDDRVRFTVNKLRTIMMARTAFITGSNPSISVYTTSPETIDKQRAYIGQRVARAYWEEHDVWDKMIDAMEWTKSCGNGYVQIYYDPSKGKVVGDGSYGQTVFSGEVGHRVRSPLELVRDPMARCWDDIQYAIVGSVLTLEEAEMRYGDKINLNEIEPTDSHIAATPYYKFYLQLNNPEDTNAPTHDQRGRPRNLLMLEYWEKPTKKHRNGRYIAVVNKQVVRKGELECGVIPIVPFYDMKEAGTIEAKTPVSDMRPLQENINRLLSLCHERSQMADIIGFPAGSKFPKKTTSFSGRPVVIGQYNPLAGGGIVNIPGGQIRADYITLFRLYEEQMENLAGVSSISTRGEPSYQMSGRMGYIVTSANQALLKDISIRFSKSVEQVMRITLMYISKYYTEERTASYINEYDRREIVRYYGNDIGTNFNVQIRLGQDLMNNPLAMAQNSLQMAQNPLIAGKIAENEILFKKWVSTINPDLAHDLFSAEQDTGVAEDENFEFSQGGMPMLKPHHNDDIHIKEHTRQLNGDEIRTWQEQCVTNLEDHVRLHEEQKAAKIRRNLWMVQGMQSMLTGGKSPNLPMPQPMTGSPGVAPSASPITEQVDRPLEQAVQQEYGI